MNMCRFTIRGIPTDFNECNDMNLKAQALFVNFQEQRCAHHPVRATAVYIQHIMVTAVAAVFSCIYLQLRLRQAVPLKTIEN